MPAAYVAPMPQDIDLVGNYTIRLTAIDPTTGALIANVNVESLVITAATVGATVPGDLAVGPFLLVPGPEA